MSYDLATVESYDATLGGSEGSNEVVSITLMIKKVDWDEAVADPDAAVALVDWINQQMENE